MKQADQFREYANKHYVEPARRAAEKIVRIKSGDIVTGLGIKDRTPNVCSALQSQIFQKRYGLELLERKSSAPKGTSTTVVFTYRILNAGEGGANTGEGGVPSRTVTFADLRGIGKKTFEALGGGEAFIRNERENFYGKDTPDLSKRG